MEGENVFKRAGAEDSQGGQVCMDGIWLYGECRCNASIDIVTLNVSINAIL